MTHDYCVFTIKLTLYFIWLLLGTEERLEERELSPRLKAIFEQMNDESVEHPVSTSEGTVEGLLTQIKKVLDELLENAKLQLIQNIG